MEDESSRPAKLRKLEQFRRHLPYLSCKALDDVLTLVKQEGCPPLHSRKHTKEAVEVTLEGLYSYGPLVEAVEASTLTGESKKVPMVNLSSLLQGLFQDSNYFFELLTHAHALNPSSFERPWRGILYADELHPGNQLSSTTRKTWIIYFSWLELTPKLLSDEKHWFTLMVIRSHETAEIEAGISQLTRLLLERMFHHDHGTPLAGILLKNGDNTLKLYWTLGLHLQDGASQRQTWANRQDTGSRFCQLCKNVFSLSNASANVEDDCKISSRHIVFQGLEICTDEEIIGSWKRLEIKQKTEKKGIFKKWQQACGFTFSQKALLMSSVLQQLALLKPVSGYCHDWMHGMASSGVLCHVMAWVLEALATSGMPNIWHTLQDYIQLWTWPGNLPGTSALHKLFSSKKVETHRKHQKMVVSASELLSLYPIVEYYLQTCCLLPDCQEQKHVYLAWCRVMDILVASSNVLPLPGHLLQTVETALALTVSAGYENIMVPKFHWALHYEDAMQRYQGLPSCWSLERKHKIARRYGTGLYNTTCYEDTLLKEVTADHLSVLKESATYQPGAHLLAPHLASRKLQAYLAETGIATAQHHCQVSNSAKLKCGSTCKVGDYVLHMLPQAPGSDFDFSAGRLECILQLGSLKVVIVQALTLKEHCWKKKVAKWSPSLHNLHVVELDLVVAVMVFNKGLNGDITTLLPPHLSQKHKWRKMLLGTGCECFGSSLDTCWSWVGSL